MKQRLISAIVALIIVVPLVIFGGIWFEIAVSILGLLAMREVLKLKNVPKSISIISLILVPILIFLDIDVINKVLFTLIIYFILLVFYDRKEYNIENCTFLTAFASLIIVVFTEFYVIREANLNVFLYLFMITILTDTFAYIGGRLFGKHKLIESVSPNKTIEGSVIGSFIGTILPTAFYVFMINPGESIVIAFIITLILSIIGQLGDLVFSSIKRYYDIKDYSNIMPGHGGILDRLDSIIFVMMGYIVILSIL
ncbi:MAG: phosphatidate cytidylyltransferase [Bacilli bacterium]|nr:phosphatidate cytidylyltransferase [Bacilli bacterium]